MVEQRADPQRNGVASIIDVEKELMGGPCRRTSANVPLPQIIGHESAGTVVEIGKAVRESAPGDRVIAESSGLGSNIVDRGIAWLRRVLSEIQVECAGQDG